MATHYLYEKRREMRMMYSKREHRHTHKPVEIYIFFIILLGIFLYCLHSYIIVFQQEQRERKAIQQMEHNLFPSILPNIRFPYQTIGMLTTDNLPNPIPEPELSDNSRNNKISWKGDCILSIPDIELEKIVYTGADRLNYLKEYGLITAADNMQYKNGGNYIICGHASRLYGHSLNRIKEIEKGTLIYIKTPDCIDQYIVDKVTFENMNETSKYCNQTPEQKVTIISCAKYVSKESYIVIQAVPNNP